MTDSTSNTTPKRRGNGKMRRGGSTERCLVLLYRASPGSINTTALSKRIKRALGTVQWTMSHLLGNGLVTVEKNRDACGMIAASDWWITPKGAERAKEILARTAHEMPENLSQEQRSVLSHLPSEGLALRHVSRGVGMSRSACFDVLVSLEERGLIRCGDNTWFPQMVYKETT